MEITLTDFARARNSASGSPRWILTDSDGNVWCTEPDSNRVWADMETLSAAGKLPVRVHLVVRHGLVNQVNAVTA